MAQTENPWSTKTRAGSGSNVLAFPATRRSTDAEPLRSMSFDASRGGTLGLSADGTAGRSISGGDIQMSDISREEVSARLEAAEARVETRLVALDSKMDRVLDAVGEARKDANDAKVAAEEARNAATSVTWNLIFVSLGTIGAIIAIYAYGTQLLELAASLIQASK